MVSADINPDTGEGIIVLKPNNSGTWRFNIFIIATLTFIAILISTYFLLQGMWLILPFSGLEIAAVYAVLYFSVRKNNLTEVIIFDKDKVVVETGRYHAEHKQEFNRAWSKIFVEQPSFRGHLKKILIRSYGKEQELGAFLNKYDRDILIKNLKHAVYC